MSNGLTFSVSPGIPALLAHATHPCRSISSPHRPTFRKVRRQTKSASVAWRFSVTGTD
ncbi:hypothetical protein BN931_1079 [Bifidobacterium animalis subsp. lactis CECT 8145]|nr:hypothetical protein W91_0528 [Bifidobacterium animalis subsp. lactis Bi-07]AJD33626.1 hypothetical protein BAA6_0513 [Bifidobacterium animalis]QIR80543.1 hypothetical protein M8PIadj_0525 [Bifidobacterium animalis]CDL71868.1 hypothetical protein BN931_1079 [Bifidobacterium animalis subsp. lactis CECT 8145]